jgi:hypothetical protein
LTIWSLFIEVELKIAEGEPGSCGQPLICRKSPGPHRRGRRRSRKIFGRSYGGLRTFLGGDVIRVEAELKLGHPPELEEGRKRLAGLKARQEKDVGFPIRRP